MAKWQTAKVFISSTFRDMHAERDHLIKVVFPELRERLLPHRIELIDIDLRWGITEEEAKKDRVLDLCLELIDECRPFFLGILGERYGWVPKTISDLAKEKYGWVQRETGKSVTELEILFGVLLMDERMKGRSFFYFRDPNALDDVPERVRSEVYVETDPELIAKLAALKQKIRECSALGYPVFDGYPAHWNEDATNHLAIDDKYKKGRLEDLEAFGRRVKRDLWRGLCRRYPEIRRRRRLLLRRTQPEPTPVDPWAEERDIQERFIHSRLNVYVGRKSLRNRLAAYADGNERELCLLTGESGSGKSAALARFVRVYRRARRQTTVVSHFIGASPRSASLREMLERLCQEVYANALHVEHVARLAAVTGLGEEAEKQRQAIEQEYSVPHEIAPLVTTLRNFLKMIPKEHRVLIVLDALNQLEEADRARELWWLPRDLDPHVRVVVSTIVAPETSEADQDPIARSLVHRDKTHLAMAPLTDADRREILRRVPAIAAKTLSESQVKALLAKPTTDNPLFLGVALEELRGFGSFDKLNERIAALPGEGVSDETYKKAGFQPEAMRQAGGPVTALFTQVIQRLETDFSPPVVHDVLTLIASARHGLSERELRDLVAGLPKGDDLFPILRQLRPYLVNRSGLLDFFHSNLLQAIERYFLNGMQQRHAVHCRLADYFRNRADPNKDGSWRGDNARSLAVLPFHLAHAGPDRKNGLATILADLRYLDARITTDSVYQLINDYDLPGVSTASLEEICCFLIRHAQSLTLHRNAFFALVYHEGPTPSREQAKELVRAGRWRKPWLRSEEVSLPSPVRNNRSPTVTIDAVCHFERSCATDLAIDRRLAFFVEKLGQIRIVDLRSAEIMPGILNIRRFRPLLLSSRADAAYVAIAYEDGRAEVCRLQIAADGSVFSLSQIATFGFHLPEVEAPVMEWDEGMLWFQSDPESICRLDPSQAKPQPQRIILPPGLVGEMSAFVSLGASKVVAFRRPDDATALVALGPEGPGAILIRPGGDAVCVCHCLDNCLALGFSDGFLEVYRLASGFTQVARLDLKHTVARLVWNGSSLICLTEDGMFLTWNPTRDHSPEDLGRCAEVFGVTLLNSPRRLAYWTPVEFGAVFHSGAFRFAIAEGTASDSGTLRLALQGPEGSGYAIRERDKEDSLVDLARRRELHFDPLDKHRLPYQYATDGAGWLLASYPTGGGLLVELSTHCVFPRGDVPSNVVCVAGDPGSGFWLSDRQGIIYRASLEDGCKQVTDVGLIAPGRSQLRCGRRHLVWYGACLQGTDWGTDVADALVAFELRPGRQLTRQGERFFSKKDGIFRALDIDLLDDSLVVVFERSAQYPSSVKSGSPEDFLGDREEEHPLLGVDLGAMRVRLTPDGSAFDLLCAEGNLFRIDRGTGRAQTVLSLGDPLTDLAVRVGGRPELVLILGKTRAIICTFEDLR